MEPMFLPEVENNQERTGAYADLIRNMQKVGQPFPQIWHLFAYKPEITVHLERWTQGVMRGPSPLPPWQRELIAAFTSKLNQCLF